MYIFRDLIQTWPQNLTFTAYTSPLVERGQEVWARFLGPPRLEVSKRSGIERKKNHCFDSTVPTTSINNVLTPPINLKPSLSMLISILRVRSSLNTRTCSPIVVTWFSSYVVILSGLEETFSLARFTKVQLISSHT